MHLTETPAGTTGSCSDEYTMHCPCRREGMSVIILREHTEGAVPEGAADPEPLIPPVPYAQIIVFGGDKTNGSPRRTLVEKIDFPAVSGTPQWDQVELLINGRLNVNVVLLPNGKVFITGGSSSGERDIELYQPPYLFRGPRPAYTIADTHFHHGDHFSIRSPDACRIKIIILMPC